MAKSCFDVQKTRKYQRFFAVVLSQKNLGSVWYVENASFCLKNLKCVIKPTLA